jgi:AAA domain
MTDGVDAIGDAEPSLESLAPEPSEEYLNKHDPDRRAQSLRALLSVDAWAEMDIPEPERLLGDLLTTTTRAFLVGRTGLGKTLLALAFAAGVASGAGFLHWRSSRPARVLYLDGEMPAELIKPRARDAIRRLGDIKIPRGNLLIFGRDIENKARQICPTLPPFSALNTDNGRLFLLALIEAVGGVDLIIFDNVMSLIAGDMKDEVPWTETLPLIATLTDKHIGQLWCDHTGHNQDRQYGSSTKAWRFDAVGIMTPLAEGQDSPSSTSFTLSFDHPGKARRRTPDNWTQFAPITIRLQDDRWTAESTDSIQRKPKAVKPSRKVFHDALVDAITLRATGPGQTSRTTWESECIRRSLMQSKADSTEPDSKRTQGFRMAISDLQAAGWIGCSGDTFTDLTRRY